ncbi:MAG TPA: septum formation initiator family protein [Pyrinomonadaceae bacterium]|nr:septum formation initiator family protein [Pyrinomonadaceae bacterium]
MNKAANTYWTNTRVMTPMTQSHSVRALSGTSPAYELPLPTRAGTRAAIRRRELSIPSWVVFCMIILATFAMCATVTMRTHAEMNAAEQKFEQLHTDVEKLRNSNAVIKREVMRMQTDPRAIEAAARTRLNMVRAHEIVVPIE